MNLDYIELFNLKTNNIKPDIGRILISEPFTVDEIFKRSVVLLTQYSSKKGAMGFILNKPVPYQDINPKLQEEFGGREINISIGGPVELDNLFYLYKSDNEIIENSIEISPNLYIGGDYLQFRTAIIKKIIPIKNVKFFFGYSGWSAGQLETEIENNFWLVKKFKAMDIFTSDKDMWANQIKQLEDKYKIWTIVPEDPRVN